MNQNETELFGELAYFQNLINQTSERLKFISDRKESKEKEQTLPSEEQLKEIIIEQEKNQPTDTMMMNLLIKSIESPVAPVIQPIVVKKEKCQTPISEEQMIDAPKTVDMLAKARQIVNSNYCQTPDTLLFYLAKRRLDIEAGEYRDTEFVKMENSCTRHGKRYKKS